jgi:hypothetical protein
MARRTRGPRDTIAPRSLSRIGPDRARAARGHQAGAAIRSGKRRSSFPNGSGMTVSVTGTKGRARTVGVQRQLEEPYWMGTFADCVLVQVPPGVSW